MLELGSGSLDEHKAMLRFAARMKPDQLVLVGPMFGQTDYQRYKALHFSDVTAAKSWFNQQNFQHACILIKGSRGIKLESIL
jgi:UDP-N-acetylmuramoyl-tripeptide--D-alanyl-D-alanine ligase